MKKIYIYLVVLTFIVMACDNDEDPIVKDIDAIAPLILVNGEASLADTFKFSMQKNYFYDYDIFDDRNIRKLSVDGLADNAFVYYQGLVLNGREYDITGIVGGTLRFRPLEAGEFHFVTTVRDEVGLFTSAILDINVLPNLIPEPKLEITQIDDLAPYQVAIDASGSFDTDAKWQGAGYR